MLDTSGIQPVRTVSRLLADAVEAEIADVRVRVASLDHLIAMKEAAGRPRDKLAAMEYRQLSDELRTP